MTNQEVAAVVNTTVSGFTVTWGDVVISLFII